jgi:opacity protein-like surface antigen
MIRRIAGRVLATAVVALSFVTVSPAAAQQTGNRPIHRFELSGGGGLFGGGGIGDRNADLRANSTTPRAFRLFSTSTRLSGAPLVQARVAFGLTRRVGLEGRFGYARPELRTSVTADAEGAAALTVVERIDQYAVDGGVVVMIDEWRLAGMTPFAAGGAGYLRQLHAGQTVVDEGHSYYVGGGVKHSFFTRDKHLIKAAGLRGDLRLELLAGGVAFDDSPKPHVAVSGEFFVSF